jgi:hypothetical protein
MKMGIFSFLAPKGPTSGGQVNFAQVPGSARASSVDIQRPQAAGVGGKARDTQTDMTNDKEWLRYLSSAIRTYRKPGLTLKDEHEIWLKARSRG